MEEKKELEVGDYVKGKIISIKPYGAFIKLETGENGLLHISEVSDNFVRRLDGFLRVDEDICVKILSIDEDNGFLKLSLKQVPYEKRIRSTRNNVPKREEIRKEEINFEPLKEKLNGWIDEAIKKEEGEK